MHVPPELRYDRGRVVRTVEAVHGTSHTLEAWDHVTERVSPYVHVRRNCTGHTTLDRQRHSAHGTP